VTLADALRFLRYLRMAVVCLLLGMALAVEMLLHAPAIPLPAPVLYAFYFLAAADAVTAIVLRQRLSGSAGEILRQNPEDAAALANWLKGQLVPLPMAMSLGFFGVAARVLGAASLNAAPFYLLAVCVVFAFRADDVPV